MSVASRTALRVVLLYAALALAWSLLSDVLPSRVFSGYLTSPTFQHLEDFAFATLTGMLLFSVVRRELRVQRELDEHELIERDLSRLLDFSRQVAQILRIEPLLDLVLDGLVDLVGCTSASIYQCQNDSLVLVAQRGYVSPDLALDGSDNWQRLYFTRAAALQEAQVIRHDLASGGSTMLVPLVLHRQLIGLLRLNHNRPGYFGERQARLALVIANQAAVALENAKLHLEAQRTAVLGERDRLARELHDSIIQEVQGLVWMIRAAREMAESNSGPVSPLLAVAAANAKASLTDLRALIFELQPELLEERGLTGMLKQWADTMRAGYPARFSLELGDEPGAPLQVKEALYRVAREAMQNAAKHADASEIVLRLQQDADQILMEVADDGIGFDPSASYPGHLGLLNMRQRVQQFDGAVDILSAPQRGTRVVVRVPNRTNSNGH